MKVKSKGKIFNIQKYSIYDGPGVRTIIFLKGCPLKCKWCSNPEGCSLNYDVMYSKTNCKDCGICIDVCPQRKHIMKNINSQFQHEIDRTIKCIGCRECEKKCPHNALHIVGEEKTVEDIMDIIEQDSVFYLTSGGGVTLSGGEATAQGEFALEILKKCKSKGINTAIETCGYTDWDLLKELSNYVDLFLYDIKHIDSEEHKNLVGVPNDKILKNIAKLFHIGANIRVRMPLIKGLNDSDDVLIGTMKFIKAISKGKNLKGVDLLPYHKLGINKYKELGREYSIKEDLTYTQEELQKIEYLLKDFDLPIKVIKH
ncbi:choline TMA-lyase-activating enzyme [Clostridium tarantellae]|uniref:Choline trimethylamine-lyase activating enzyme n=1 Tax=Clostridium tarantellae TaxID=39493 RepID=A0A6I1MN11_9CLOT|nr:choline TMA-lyase-activating enzyme [Clostridium tarantellae]MPQ43632.1 choline TMA-lyase-activating enzyme [Clostridium tarantellae]